MPPPTPNVKCGIQSVYDQLTELNNNICQLHPSNSIDVMKLVEYKITEALKTIDTIAGKQKANLLSASSLQKSDLDICRHVDAIREKLRLAKKNDLLKLEGQSAKKKKVANNKKRKASHDAAKYSVPSANNLTSQEMMSILKLLANAESKDESGQEESPFVDQNVLESEKTMWLTGDIEGLMEVGANLEDYRKRKAEEELENSAAKKAKSDLQAQKPAEEKPAHVPVDVAIQTTPGAPDLTSEEAINALKLLLDTKTLPPPFFSRL